MRRVSVLLVLTTSLVVASEPSGTAQITRSNLATVAVRQAVAVPSSSSAIQQPVIADLVSACGAAVQAEATGTREPAADRRCDQAIDGFIAAVPGVPGTEAQQRLTSITDEVRSSLVASCRPWLRCQTIVDRRYEEASAKAKEIFAERLGRQLAGVFAGMEKSRSQDAGRDSSIAASNESARMEDEAALRAMEFLREQDALDRRNAELLRTPETLTWAAGEAHSRAYFLQGHQVRMVVTESFSVLAYVESFNDPIAIRMHFRNTTDRAFDVLPETFALSVLEPVAKPLPYVSPKQIAKKIENEATWAMVAEAINSAGRAIAGTSTTSTTGAVAAWSPRGGSAYGTYNGLTTTYDNAANQRLTGENIARIGTIAEAEKVIRLTGALLANTVFGGQEFGGLVHFKRDKRATAVLLRVPLAGHVVELPLDVPSK